VFDHRNIGLKLCRQVVLLPDLLREQDSLQMTELHPSDFPLLRAEFQKDSRARVDPG
jgi:23S rRNA A2030 N6-methylase RlmJ